MSGHEKFYIPHDDLQELITAIETLTVDIGTLTTDINTLDTHITNFTERFLSPSNELVETGEATTTVVDDSPLLVQKALNTTTDTFLRALHIVVSSPDGNPLLNYDSDIILSIDDTTGQPYFQKMIFEGTTKAAKVAASTVHGYRKTYYLNDARLVANTSVRIYAYCQNIRTNTVITVYLSYITKANA